MRFHADLHVHSKYSRATSRDLDLEHLAAWASRKGIAVVATGDFTHPVWLAELKQKLVPAEPGLFRLRGEVEREIARTLPASCRAATRFMLSVEISTIYKKGDRTRKIHHLLYAPDFDAADRIVARLARIGNLAADGRPILGLDSRHLLEIVLESHPASYLIPAHIWTPWFAVLGSQSGFDSIVECYGDLADHIFAVETGLSSDPPMNWRLSFLDRYRLVSNSDAHSPAKLGRETTVFEGELDYFAIRRTLETGRGYVGTVEFFPEEGKYHLDGHRRCGVRLTPQETLDHQGRCPGCGQSVTVGVLHRVETLADRADADVTPPATGGEVSNLVPLVEVVAEIVGSGPSSKTVERGYDRLVSTLGSELSILTEIPVEEIARADSTLLAEAITRLRAGQVIRDAGYDGEYGVIRLFEPGELQQRTMGGLLFDVPASQGATSRRRKPAAAPEPSAAGPRTPELDAPKLGVPEPSDPATSAPPTPAPANAPALRSGSSGILAQLDDEQRRAATTVAGSLLIVAGPGSGKTRTLTHRIAHLIDERGVPPAACLAITFTRRAAAEMRERLAALLPAGSGEVPIHTFHSLGLTLLREHAEAAGLPPHFRIAGEAERAEALGERLGVTERRTHALLRAISKSKRTQRPASTQAAEALEVYRDLLAQRQWVDFDDLVGLAVRLLDTNPDIASQYRERFRYVSVDEFQDVDEQQYRLLTLLAPPGANLCAIGDPNQAIYGFRGADASCFDRFTADYPKTAVVTLARNYRSSGTIVAASSQVIARGGPAASIAEAARDMLDRITIHTAPTDRAEAEFVVHTIEQIIGGHSFFSIDSGRTDGTAGGGLSFADFAVLYRTDAQAAPLCEAFARSGIPFKKHSHEPLAAQADVRALLPEVDPDVIALMSDMDLWDPRADRVSLLTLHAAKGLEFPVVFIVGLEDGLLPLRWGGPSDDAAAGEERRLFYVGMTRAKDRLFVSRAVQRPWRGQLRTPDPSPFLSDIEAALVKHQERRAGSRPPEAKQLSLL